jgi:hypothetical protein
MSKLSKLQDERLKKLKEVSSAGRHQRDEVLEQAQPVATAEGPAEPVELQGTGTGPAEIPTKPAPTSAKPEPKIEKRVGRPPRPEPVYQRTVNFTEDQLEKLERLSARSGRKGFRSPTFNETVRVALRLWASHAWTEQEIRSAFDAEFDGFGKG